MVGEAKTKIYGEEGNPAERKCEGNFSQIAGITLHKWPRPIQSSQSFSLSFLGR
jgi:hypothetical protein